MTRPKSERNGESDGQEANFDAMMNSGKSENLGAVLQDTPAPDVPRSKSSEISPVAEPESPVKQVVFRSTDKELTLYYRAGYTDKSHGIASYNPSIGIRFDDYHFRIDDTPENEKTIAWLRNHQSYDFSFREVPDMNNIIELPAISELEQMTYSELKGLCYKNVVKHADDASKEALILALLKNQR